MDPIISSGTLDPTALSGRVAVVTGAGRGVGLETARALARLGAKVVIAEIDETTGREAADLIRDESSHGAATFVRVDVGDEVSLADLVREVTQELGPIDIVVNNATVTPFGPVQDVPLSDWDLSYRVNLRGPAALARLTVPGMRERGYGVFVCLSSVGGAFMAPYEALKAAQVELAVSLAAELEDTGVFAFAIGPGQVMTPGLEAGVKVLAPLYGMGPDEFLALNSANTVTAEEAGTGIAAAIALAEKFHGAEVSSAAGLTAAGIGRAGGGPTPPDRPASASASEIAPLLDAVRATLAEQAGGWATRGIFERKWMERDFRRNAGMSAGDVLEEFDRLSRRLADGQVSGASRDALAKLHAYYGHYADLARGNTKDPEVLATHLDIIAAWQAEIAELQALLGD